MTFRESFTVCQKAGNGLGVSQSCENACLRKCVPAREVVDKCVEDMEHAIGSFSSFGRECRHICTHTRHLAIRCNTGTFLCKNGI